MSNKIINIQTIQINTAGSIDTTLTALLHTIGVPANIKGYRCLKEAIKAVIENPTMIESTTKELYPHVGRITGTTASRAERAMRHAIECAWDRGDIDVLHSFFGNTVSRHKGKPTNSEFIATIAEYLTMEQAK